MNFLQRLQRKYVITFMIKKRPILLFILCVLCVSFLLYSSASYLSLQLVIVYKSATQRLLYSTTQAGSIISLTILCTLLHLVPDHSLVTKDFCEPTHILACPAIVHFAVLAKLAAH